MLTTGANVKFTKIRSKEDSKNAKFRTLNCGFSEEVKVKAADFCLFAQSLKFTCSDALVEMGNGETVVAKKLKITAQKVVIKDM